MENQKELMLIPGTENEEDFDLDELYAKLEEYWEADLAFKYAELEYLKGAEKNIGNPDNLGQVVYNEVWKQFANQIGLEAVDETLLQQYDRLHPPEGYKEIAVIVMRDQRYVDAHQAMKEAQEAGGTLLDTYTGKPLKLGVDQPNLDHVVSRKELYDDIQSNVRLKQANIRTEDIANLSENLRPTNESLNKSKREKSVEDYLSNRDVRERDLKIQAEKAKEKIDASNKSDLEKRLDKEEIDKRLQDKLNADSARMRQADKEAREAIGKYEKVEFAKSVGAKAGIDALKMIVVSGLSALLKEVVSGLIRFFKATTKSLKKFASEMKEAISRFFAKIKYIFHGGATTALSTVLGEIWAPIKKTFKFIRQGVSTVVDAVKYLASEEGRNASSEVKMREVMKIIVGGLTAGAAIVFGEVLATLLKTIPGLQIIIPLVGSLASIIGFFLSSLVCGVIGAVVLNRLDNVFAEAQRTANLSSQHDKANEILVMNNALVNLKFRRLEIFKKNTESRVRSRHIEMAADMKDIHDKFEQSRARDAMVRANDEKVKEEDEMIHADIDQGIEDIKKLLDKK